MKGWFCTRCWQVLQEYEVSGENHRRCGGRVIPVSTAQERLARLEVRAAAIAEEEEEEEPEDIDQRSWPAARIRNPKGTY